MEEVGLHQKRKVRIHVSVMIILLIWLYSVEHGRVRSLVIYGARGACEHRISDYYSKN